MALLVSGELCMFYFGVTSWNIGVTNVAVCTGVTISNLGVTKVAVFTGVTSSNIGMTNVTVCTGVTSFYHWGDQL